MDKKQMIWAVVIILGVLYLTGNLGTSGQAIDFGDWSDVGNDLVSILKSIVTSIVDLMKQNPLLTGAIIIGLFLMFTSKR